MAVSRHSQKDIGNYEAKLLGPFTTRQVIFLAIGLVPTLLIDYVLYMLAVDIYTIFGVTFIIMAVPCFFAFGQSLTYDMKPEDFIKDYYTYHVLAPRKRLYKTETLDDILEKEAKREQKATSEESDENAEEIEDETGKKGKKKKGSKDAEANLKTFGKMKLYPHKTDAEFQEFE